MFKLVGTVVLASLISTSAFAYENCVNTKYEGRKCYNSESKSYSYPNSKSEQDLRKSDPNLRRGGPTSGYSSGGLPR